MSLARWSLEKVQFLLAHVEDFVEDDKEDIRKKMAEFEVQTDLEKVSSLAIPSEEPDQTKAVRVFEKLAPFYEAGVLMQKTENWRLTGFFWKGQIFPLEADAQMPADAVLKEISPLEVNRAPAVTVLNELGLHFLPLPASAQGFLFKPASNVAYILMSDLPELWSEGHVSSTQRLLNNSFLL